jgi:hypothetical protein
VSFLPVRLSIDGRKSLTGDDRKQLAEKFKAAREQEAKKATEGPSQGQQQGQGIQKSK